MKIKNLDLVKINNILVSMGEKRVPQRISFAIIKNITGLKDDYNCYVKSLNKIFDSYSGYFIMGDNGQFLQNEIGVPILDNEDKTKEMSREIDELLNIEIDVQLYTIDEDCFDYEAGDKYDTLTPAEMLNLMNVLCKE